MKATDTELLTYGTHELAAFRADMKARSKSTVIDDKPTCKGIATVLRNQTARRNAAGLTPAQAERACILAAAVERKEAHL